MFTYAAYREYLRHLRTSASLHLFSSWKGQPGVLLRHDVDFDLEPACRLAEVEAEEGVASTYFVMTTCHEYNVLSPENRLMLRRLRELGHEVGLHFDPMAHPDADDERLAAEAGREAAVLGSVVGAPVGAVSLHNPSLHGMYPLFPGFMNAYDPALFSSDRYLSDSRRDFRGKDPFAFVAAGREKALQVLLHPMHYSEDGGGYVQTMRRYAQRRLAIIEEKFLVNQTFADELNGGRLLDALFSEGAGR